jgi:hypothetical protein
MSEALQIQIDVLKNQWFNEMQALMRQRSTLDVTCPH